MLTRIFLFGFLILSLSSSAQEVKENFELAQTTLTGDSVLITGFKPDSKNLDFVAVLYDKNLKEIVRYAKKIEAGTKSYFVERINNTFRFTFYSSTSKIRYRISTDLGLKQLYAGVPVENEITDENVMELGEWTYAEDYCNDYVFGSLMIDVQLAGITCYTLLDPLEGTYRMKWEKTFDGEGEMYQKVEILGFSGSTMYVTMTGIAVNNMQKIMAIELNTGVEKFTQRLNGAVKTDSIKTIGVSNMYTDGKTIFLAGTYLLDDPSNPYPYRAFTDGQSKSRGYDNLDYYIMYMADGYFVMSLDAATGDILAFKDLVSPSVDETIDRRDYRVAVCPGIAPLKNGKFVAFFEQLSCRTTIGGSDAPFSGRSLGDEVTPRNIIWDLDAFTSVVFDAGLTDVTTTTTIWEEENVTYNLTDFDMIALNVHTEYPHDFVTIGEDGCYPHQFICDGVNWSFVIRCDSDMVPDFLLKANESEQKVVKLLNARIVYMLTPDTAVEEKTTENSITLKVVKH